MNDKLSKDEKSVLSVCEKKIESVEGGFYEEGMALARIRDQSLYRGDYRKFEDYCVDRWDMSMSYANRKIRAAELLEILETLVPIGTHLLTESQVRELINLNPKPLREIFETAIATAPNGKLTAAHIREVKEEYFENPEQEVLFKDLKDYQDAIEVHAEAIRKYKTGISYHVRQAKKLQNEAYKKFGEQIELPFDIVQFQD